MLVTSKSSVLMLLRACGFGKEFGKGELLNSLQVENDFCACCLLRGNNGLSVAGMGLGLRYIRIFACREGGVIWIAKQD